jgi:hypothetical protein
MPSSITSHYTQVNDFGLSEILALAEFAATYLRALKKVSPNGHEDVNTQSSVKMETSNATSNA